MSTELFGLTKNSVISIGDVSNAWRGAMAIWSFLEEKYLPPYRPSWYMPGLGFEPSRCADSKSMQEIWDLSKSPKLTKAEKIVLCSTFDNVLAKVSSINKVLAAFREFEGETSLKEQANLIEAAIKENPDLIAIGWNQTSVNGDTWASDNYDEEKDEYLGYNLETGKRHWFLIEELEDEDRTSCAPEPSQDTAEVGQHSV